jgi:histidinol-phosphate aminotransferase
MNYEKKSIKHLINYQTIDRTANIKLDANESKNYLFPNGVDLSNVQLNLYPDNQALELRNALSIYTGMPIDMIVEGNGSSELIELLMKTFLEKGDDVYTFDPTFSMYKIYAQIYEANYTGIPSNNDFTVNVDHMIDMILNKEPKMIVLCSPNNPTGNQMSRKDIIKIVESTKALVVVDEAYIEFADHSQTVINDTLKYENLIVLRTFSKAFGLASIRLGYMISPVLIANSIKKVKSPYHVNALSQCIGTLALNRQTEVNKWVHSIVLLRHQFMKDLNDLKIKTFQSAANFIFMYSQITDLFEKLASKGILIRAFKGTLEGFYRITIGTQTENETVIQALKEIIHESNN